MPLALPRAWPSFPISTRRKSWLCSALVQSPFQSGPRIQERAPCLRAWGLLNLGALHFVRPGPTGSSGRERTPPTLAPKCSLLPDISSWASLGPLTEMAAKP